MDNGVVLAQEAIYQKTNEIPVFQEMPTYLDVEGKMVTLTRCTANGKPAAELYTTKGIICLA